MTFLKRRILRILGTGFEYEDEIFNTFSYVNKDLISMGSSTLKNLIGMNIPFTVGRYGDGYFRVTFYPTK